MKTIDDITLYSLPYTLLAQLSEFLLEKSRVIYQSRFVYQFPVY